MSTSRTPLSDAQLGEKLRRPAGARVSAPRLEALQDRLLRLDEAAEVSEIGPLLRGDVPAG